MKAILTYHSLDRSGSPISVSPEAFRGHCERLAAHGPRVVQVAELLRLPPEESAVALTFDDAYANFAEHAWPVLREHGLPVTLFVPTGLVGEQNRWDAGQQAMPQLEILDWAALIRLAEEGVTLASHTRTHPRLPGLGSAQVADELERSAADLERATGHRPAGLAYPYGAVSEAVAVATARTYDWACTTELRPLRAAEAIHRLPRIDMYYLRDAAALDAWGTPRLRLYLRSRAGLRRCRELLAAGVAS